jgi:mono/diheme cytochrome c family protein
MRLTWLLLLFSLFLANPANPAEFNGQALYVANCANCHGLYGEGDGPIAPSLPVVLQDLRYIQARNGGKFPTKLVRELIDGRSTRATHGPEGMPVWGVFLAQDDPSEVEAKLDALVGYTRSMQNTE